MSLVRDQQIRRWLQRGGGGGELGMGGDLLFLLDISSCYILDIVYTYVYRI